MAGLTLTAPAAAAAYITVCLQCGNSPQPIAGLENPFGFRLVEPEELPLELPHATDLAIKLPEPVGARS